MLEEDGVIDPLNQVQTSRCQAGERGGGERRRRGGGKRRGGEGTCSMPVIPPASDDSSRSCSGGGAPAIWGRCGFPRVQREGGERWDETCIFDGRWCHGGERGGRWWVGLAPGGCIMEAIHLPNMGAPPKVETREVLGWVGEPAWSVAVARGALPTMRWAGRRPQIGAA